MNGSNKARLDLEVLEAAETADQAGKHQQWERQPGETSKSFAAFQKYLNLSERRTLAKVAEMSGCSAQNIERWSRRWSWVARVRAWDVIEEERFREQTARDRTAHRRREIQVGQVLQSVAVAGLRELQQRVQQELPLNLSPSEVAILLKLGNEMESHGLGENSEAAKYTRINVVLGDAEPIADLPAESSPAMLNDDTTGESLEDDRAHSWKNPPQKLAN